MKEIMQRRISQKISSVAEVQPHNLTGRLTRLRIVQCKHNLQYYCAPNQEALAAIYSVATDEIGIIVESIENGWPAFSLHR